MSMNQHSQQSFTASLAEVSDVEEQEKMEQARQTFLTDVQVRLARQQIEKPEGAHNTELEEALAGFRRATEELKRAQHDFVEKNEGVEKRKASLTLKQQELEGRLADLANLMRRQKEKERLINQQFESKRIQIQEELGGIADLMDQIAGAAALLQQLKQKNVDYSIYTEFVKSIYYKLNGSPPVLPETVSEMERLNAQARFKQTCLEEVRNRFIRLTKEEKQSQQLEAVLSKQYDCVQNEAKTRLAASRALISELEQRFAKLSSELEKLTVSRELFVQDNQILNFKLHQRTQELSNVQSAIQNLVDRIKNKMEDRQIMLADRAQIRDLLGGDNAKLIKQVNRYFEKSRGLVPKEECFVRVLGPTLLQRMRDVYKLGLFLRDMQDLVKLCSGEKLQ